MPSAERRASLLDKLEDLEARIGNTPLVQLRDEGMNLYAKLESANLFGSIKDRAALYILKQAVLSGEVGPETTVIESSSGNFAIGLAMICRYIGLRFVAVIDPNITQVYEHILRVNKAEIVKVTQRDCTGGFLISRLQQVSTLLKQRKDSFWTNQYGNEAHLRAHYEGLGVELAGSFESLDFVFIAVSSGGTISGVSRRLKEKFPRLKVIAVDVEGSVIFRSDPKSRRIPGIGSSIRPALVEKALIDDVVIVPEIDAALSCRRLLQDHALFMGGSSGAVYQAIHNYFAADGGRSRPSVAFICPDKGTAYLGTIYDDTWLESLRVPSAGLVTSHQVAGGPAVLLPVAGA